MMTASSPLMGEELAEFAYLLMVPKRVDSPTGIRCWKMICAPETSRHYARAKTDHFAVRADPQIGVVLA